MPRNPRPVSATPIAERKAKPDQYDTEGCRPPGNEDAMRDDAPQKPDQYGRYQKVGGLREGQMAEQQLDLFIVNPGLKALFC
jgi:hypothetical protein